MKYFKIFKENEFIGIANSNNFLTYQEQNNLLMITNEEIGQFVEYNNQLYRDTWMQPLPSHNYNYEIAMVYEITKEEYDILAESIEKHEEIIIDDPPIYEPTIIPDVPDISVGFVRENKIEEMSYVCRTTIETGFDLPMTDGETHHFSLSQQDQLNLMTLSILAETEDIIPYHADGEESKFYTAAEIKLIINTANTFKNYQLAYYNSLKSYINALETIEEIAAITYGTPIPEEYKSDVLKVLE